MSAAASPLVVDSAAALIIGGELLNGKIPDENSAELARTLRSLGIQLRQISVVPDDLQLIHQELSRLRQLADVVVTSGGVGPTHDDVTIDAIASSLGHPVVEARELRRLLEQVYGTRLTAAHLRMARVPEGARLLYGAEIRWPLIVADDVWIFPGVPELFRLKLQILREHLVGPLPFFSEEIYLSAEEADIKLELDRVVTAHPEVEIGSYPQWRAQLKKTRITFDSRDAKLTRAARLHLKELLAAHVVEDTEPA